MTGIRLELTGKSAEAFDRVFDKLTFTIERAVDALIPERCEDVIDPAKELARDLAEISKTWIRAKIERPTLENEKIVADIVSTYEAAKKTKSERLQIEVQTERDRIRLFEEQMIAALRMLDLLNRHVVRDDEGNVTLVLTNATQPSLTTSNLENNPRISEDSPAGSD